MEIILPFFNEWSSVICSNFKDTPQIMGKTTFQTAISECINNQRNQATGQSQMEMLQKVYIMTNEKLPIFA